MPSMEASGCFDFVSAFGLAGGEREVASLRAFSFGEGREVPGGNELRSDGRWEGASLLLFRSSGA
jgi:hypothetical protein